MLLQLSHSERAQASPSLTECYSNSQPIARCPPYRTLLRIGSTGAYRRLLVIACLLLLDGHHCGHTLGQEM